MEVSVDKCTDSEIVALPLGVQDDNISSLDPDFEIKNHQRGTNLLHQCIVLKNVVNDKNRFLYGPKCTIV